VWRARERFGVNVAFTSLLGEYRHLQAVGGKARVEHRTTQAGDTHLLHAAVGQEEVANLFVHLGGPA